VSLALLLPARSADRKKSLQFGRRGGGESGLLNEPRLSSLLLGFTGRLEGCSLGSFRGCSLCGFARYRFASDPLSFGDPDVAGAMISDRASIRLSLAGSSAIVRALQFEPSSQCWQHLNGL
jgi:hypothetical protein